VTMFVGGKVFGIKVGFDVTFLVGKSVCTTVGMEVIKSVCEIVGASVVFTISGGSVAGIVIVG